MFASFVSYVWMTLHAMRVAAIMVGMLVSLVFAKKLAGEETNRQKEMRFDDQHVTNGLSESRSPFFLCALIPDAHCPLVISKSE